MPNSATNRFVNINLYARSALCQNYATTCSSKNKICYRLSRKKYTRLKSFEFEINDSIYVSKQSLNEWNLS